MTDLASTSSSRTPFRTVFIVSDGTGITAETFNYSILTRFRVKFHQVRTPFVDTIDRARIAVAKINEALHIEGVRPIVFTTLVDAEANEIIYRAKAAILDMSQTFIEPLERKLSLRSTHAIGRFHQNADTEAYRNHIEATSFSLAHDNGQSRKSLAETGIILVGVSRSGKTPTSLCPAMQYGVKSANYPLVPDDFERGKLPSVPYDYKSKIFGSSIDPRRLLEIHNERRSGNKYAALENCRYEISEAEVMIRRKGIKQLSSTHKSIEEIATAILQDIKMNHNNY